MADMHAVVHKPATAPATLVVVAVSAFWIWARVHLLHESILLSYVLPLLLCIWTQRYWQLWTLAGLFVLAALGQFWLGPEAMVPLRGSWVTLVSTLLNITVGAAIAAVIMRLRGGLETYTRWVAAQNTQIRAQAQDLVRQNQQIETQTTELRQQNTQLEQANTDLTRRRDLLQVLLGLTGQPAAGERSMQEICRITLAAVGPPAMSVTILERQMDQLVVRSATGPRGSRPVSSVWPYAGSLAELVIRERRTQCVEDLPARADITIPCYPDVEAQSAMAAPIYSRQTPVGAVVVCAAGKYQWSGEQSRIVQWMAGQCSLILEASDWQNELHEVALLAQENPDAVIRVLHGGTVIYANPAGIHLLRERGSGVDQAIPTEFWNAAQEALRLKRVTDHGVTVGDREYAVRCVPVTDRAYVNLYAHDMTARRHAERALHEAYTKAEFLSRLLQESSQPFATGYPDGRLMATNPAFASLTGYEEQELHSMTWMELTPPEWHEHEARVLEVLHRTGKPQLYQKQYIRKDGTHILIEIKVHLARNERGEVAYYYAFVTDITDRKRREANLAFLAEATEDLASLSSAREIMETVGAKIGAYLHVESCSFCEVDETRDQITIAHGWHMVTVPDLPRTFRMSDYFGEGFKQANRLGQTMAIADTQTDPRTAAKPYLQLNIRAVLSVPFYHRSNQWTNALAVADSHPRDWRRDEIELFEELANRIFPRMERARAEEALRESRSALQSFYDSSPLMMGVAEINGKTFVTTEANLATSRFFNVRQEQMPWRLGGDLGPHNEINHLWLTHCRLAQHEGVPSRFEYQHQTPQGPRWLQVTIAYLGTSAQGYARFSFVAEDITGRRKTEEVLRNREERLRFVTDRAQIGYWHWDLAHNRLEWSASCKRLFGIGEDERVSYRRFLASVHPEDRAQVDGAVRAYLGGGGKDYDIEFRSQWPDGTVRWVHARGSATFEAGDPIRMAGIALDITQRKQAEETLRRAVQRCALLAETAELLLRTPQPQMVIEELYRKVMHHLDCDMFLDYLAAEGSARMHLDAWEGILADDVQRIEWLDTGEAICGQVARTHQPIVLQDIQHSSDLAPGLVRTYGVQAYSAHPLLAGDRLMGVLSFGTKQRTTFTADEIGLMRAVAEQVSVAMERRRAERESHEARIAAHAVN